MRFPIRTQSILALLTLATSGCFHASLEEVGASSATSGNLEGASLPIYRLWAGSDSSPTLDLRNFRAPATQKIRFDLEAGRACECVTGSISGGMQLQITQCKNAAGTTGEVGCSLFNNQYVLIQNGNVLEVCDAESACNRFR